VYCIFPKALLVLWHIGIPYFYPLQFTWNSYKFKTETSTFINDFRQELELNMSLSFKERYWSRRAEKSSPPHQYGWLRHWHRVGGCVSNGTLCSALYWTRVHRSLVKSRVPFGTSTVYRSQSRCCILWCTNEITTVPWKSNAGLGWSCDFVL
jgi:hypothetical protein